MSEQPSLQRYKWPIIIGGGGGLALLYFISRSGAPPAPAGDGGGAALQSAFNTIMQSVQAGLKNLRDEFEARFGAIEAQSAEQTAAVGELEAQLGQTREILTSLSSAYEALSQNVSGIVSAEGLGEQIKANMLATAKTLFLSLESGSRDRKRLNFLKNYVLDQLRRFGYPQDVIDSFLAWVDPHIEHSVTGQRPPGFEGGIADAGLTPFYDAVSPILDRAFDQSLEGISLRNMPVVGRWGLL